MNLKELFDKTVFLGEDNRFIGGQPFDTTQEVFFTDECHAKPAGSFNGTVIWESYFFPKEYILYGILNEERNPLSWCVFNLEKNPGYLTFIRAFTEKEHRGKDLMLTMVNFLIEKCKKKILIDKKEETSSDSRRMIKKWANYDNHDQVKRHFKIKVLDKDKKEIDTPLDSVLTALTLNDNYILFETTNDRVYPSLYGGPSGKGKGQGVLSDWVWY